MTLKSEPVFRIFTYDKNQRYYIQSYSSTTGGMPSEFELKMVIDPDKAARYPRTICRLIRERLQKFGWSLHQECCEPQYDVSDIDKSLYVIKVQTFSGKQYYARRDGKHFVMTPHLYDCARLSKEAAIMILADISLVYPSSKLFRHTLLPIDP